MDEAIVDPDFVWTRIAAHLAEVFVVSKEAAEKALAREGIRESFRSW